MTANTRRTRLRKLVVVTVLGVALGVGAYLAYQVASVPGARPAPGWSLLAEMPNPRGETAAAVAGDRMFVIGGLIGLAAQASAEVSVYDPVAASWQSGPPLPEPRHHAAAAGLADSVYVSGGAASVVEWSPRDQLWVLAPGAASWQALAPMPDARYGHRVVALGERLYVVGGISGTPGTGPDPGVPVLVYDPVSSEWSTGAPLPVNRDHLAVVVAGGEIWAIGGREGGVNHVRVDIYDPAADAWRDGPPLPAATSGASEGVVDGVILISGGEDPGAGLIVDRHWGLDTSAGSAATWEPLQPPPFTVHGAPGVVLERRFVVVSGALRAAGQSSTAWTGATQVLNEVP